MMSRLREKPRITGWAGKAILPACAGRIAAPDARRAQAGARAPAVPDLRRHVVWFSGVKVLTFEIEVFRLLRAEFSGRIEQS